jgi:hypothetical protein
MLLIVFALLILSLFALVERKRKLFIFLPTFVIFSSLIFSDTTLKFDKHLFNRNFPDTTIEQYKYSPCGQVVLLQKNNKYYLLSNNILIFSSPARDILHSEDFGHIPILHH